MKKTIILSVLGLTAVVASSYGQGTMTFNTYNSNNSNGFLTTYGNGPSVGTAIGTTFTGELLWSSVNIVDAASTAGTAANPLTAGWTVGSTSTFATGSSAVPGFITGPNVVIPAASGTYYFEVVAFNGLGWGQGTYQGHSASFSAVLATGETPPDANQINNMTAFSVYNIASIPEPTTLALAGLGGLASLVALRRKQA
jgi:hypothetical protein